MPAFQVLGTRVGEASKKAGDGLDAVLGVIPAIYYDLIARICPGIAFWLGLSINESRAFSLSGASSMVPDNVLLLVVLSYLSGIVLTGFAIFWDYATLGLFLALGTRFSGSLGLTSAGGLPTQWMDIARKMDEIAKKNDEAGRTVTKSLAEVALCENLLTGLIALILIRLCLGSGFFVDLSKHGLPLLLLGLTFFTAIVFRQAMFLGRVRALHLTYVGAANPAFSAAVIWEADMD